MLYKQDEICVLEEELGRIDKSEPCELFLGNRRRDKNQQRKVVMKSLEEKLAEYGSFSPGGREEKAHRELCDGR